MPAPTQRRYSTLPGHWAAPPLYVATVRLKECATLMSARMPRLKFHFSGTDLDAVFHMDNAAFVQQGYLRHYKARPMAGRRSSKTIGELHPCATLGE